MSEETNHIDGDKHAVPSNPLLGGWIPVSDVKSLPKKDEWVQVYEDDDDNRQDAVIGRLTGSLRKRVVPAKLLYIDQEGNADWYLCCIGGPYRHTRNVTHWKPLSDPPNPTEQGMPHGQARKD